MAKGTIFKNKRRKKFNPLKLILIFVIIFASIFAFKSVANFISGKGKASSSTLPVVSSPATTISPVNNNLGKPTVMLDAGHGGEDIGCSYGSILEKDLTLKIAKDAQSYLESQGVNVIMTRETDVFHYVVDLESTVNASDADLYVSVHINYFDQSSVYSGVQTDYDYFTSGFGAKCKELAQDIHSSVISSDSWKDRGLVDHSVKSDHERLYLRKLNVTSALVECGFLSNAEDRARLTNDKVLENLGENISKGIIKYLKDIGKLK